MLSFCLPETVWKLNVAETHQKKRQTNNNWIELSKEWKEGKKNKYQDLHKVKDLNCTTIVIVMGCIVNSHFNLKFGKQNNIRRKVLSVSCVNCIYSSQVKGKGVLIACAK